MKFFNLSVAISLVVFLFTSCESDDDADYILPDDYESGIIVSHEGGFTSSGTTSFVSYDLSSSQNDIYKVVNGEQLGSFQQSIGFSDESAFIVVDNQNTITKVNRYTFEYESQITEGLNTPRFVTISNGYAYVSNWGDPFLSDDDFIAVINLSDNSLYDTIDVDLGPEQLKIVNNKLYVSHKGAYGFNNIISVIDLTTNSVSKEIEVGYLPNDMIIVNNDLWVATQGKRSWHDIVTIDEVNIGETPGALYVIDTITNEVSNSYELSESTNHIGELAYDNTSQNLYYNVGNEIFSFSTSAESLSDESITSTTSIYGMSVNDGFIYTVDPVDYASEGFLNVYNISTDTWVDTITLGLVPSKIYFN